MRRPNPLLWLIPVLTSAVLAAFPAVVQAQDNAHILDALEGTSSYDQPATWGVSYFNLTAADLAQVNRGAASWNIYQYVSFNYKLSPVERIGLRPTFITTTAGVYDNYGDTRPMETRIHDFHVTYSNYEMGTMPGDWDVSGTFYLYLPTSQTAQDKKWSAHIASWMIFDRMINRDWSITWNFKPHYWFNTQKAYRKETSSEAPDGSTFNKVYAENNEMGEITQYFELSRYFNRYFTPQIAVGTEHEWYTDSNEANSKPALIENFVIAPSTWIMVNRSLRFIFQIENSINIRNPQQEFQLFRESELQYLIFTFWTIQ